METKKISIVAHGGAGSENKHSDGTEKAVEICRKAVQDSTSLIHAVSIAVAVLKVKSMFALSAAINASTTLSTDIRCPWMMIPTKNWRQL